MDFLRNLFGKKYPVATPSKDISWSKAQELLAKRDVRGLIKVLHEAKSEDVRGGAALMLGNIGDPLALEPLIAALKDPASSVRQDATKALANLGSAKAIEPLRAALNDPNEQVREDAKYALSRIKTDRDVVFEAEAKGDSDRIKSTLNDENPSVRCDAIRALERLSDPQAVDAIIIALKDSNLSVRKEAARALGKFGAPRAVEPLFACMRDDDENLRAYAMQSLVMTTSALESLLKLLISTDDRKARNSAVDALSGAIRFGALKTDPRAAILVRSAIKEGWGKVETISLVGLLVELGDERAQRLLNAAQTDDKYTLERILNSF